MQLGMVMGVLMDGTAFDALMAQRDAAYWAGVSAVAAWAALIALPINGVGLYLVWRQLRINERALKDAARSADAAVVAADTAAQTTRPWMSLDVNRKNCRIIKRKDGYCINVDVCIKNIGKTPAVGVWVVQKSESYKNDCSLVDQLTDEHLDWQQKAGRTIFPNEEERSSRNIWLYSLDGEVGRSWSFAVVVFYYIPGSDERRQTSKVFRLDRKDDVPEGGVWVPDVWPNLIARRDPT